MIGRSAVNANKTVKMPVAKYDFILLSRPITNSDVVINTSTELVMGQDSKIHTSQEKT